MSFMYYTIILAPESSVSCTARWTFQGTWRQKSEFKPLLSPQLPHPPAVCLYAVTNVLSRLLTVYTADNFIVWTENSSLGHMLCIYVSTTKTKIK